MDTQLSPGDYALLDEKNTSIIPETPNSIGQSLIRRLGLAEAEAASTFLNNNNPIFMFYDVKFWAFSVSLFSFQFQPLFQIILYGEWKTNTSTFDMLIIVTQYEKTVDLRTITLL